MKKTAVLVAVAIFTGGLPTTAPDAAAEGQTTIKVALTDMSASAAMGPMGQMMM